MSASDTPFQSVSPDFNLKKPLLFISLALLFIALGPRFASADDPFCVSLEEIIQSGQHKFKSIRGKLDLVSEEYFGRVTPPELKDCFGWLDGKAYHCTSEAGMNDTEVALAYDRFNKMIQSCLSKEWQTTEVNMQRANAKRFMTYASPSNPVEIKIGERSKRHGWFVDFYFKR